MSVTYLLSVLASGMALFLFPAEAKRNSPETTTVRSAQQEESRVQVDVDQDERDMDMDVEMDMNVDVDMDVEEPHVDVDEDRDESEMDADGDHEDIDHDESFTEQMQEKIEKSFAMPAGAGRRTLEIDNIWGSIELTGVASDQVQLTVNKSIRAESKGKIDQARKDVTLDITQQGDGLKMYVNGPFRCNCHDCGRSRDNEGYIVKMDFQVQVPRDVFAALPARAKRLLRYSPQVDKTTRTFDGNAKLEVWRWCRWPSILVGDVWVCYGACADALFL